MTMTDNTGEESPPRLPAPPVVREGDYDGAAYRIETWHEPEEL